MGIDSDGNWTDGKWFGWKLYRLELISVGNNSDGNHWIGIKSGGNWSDGITHGNWTCPI